MSKQEDIRWIQRFSNYKKALNQLLAAADLAKQRSLSHLEQQGLIQAFGYTYELGWKTLQDFLRDKGYPEIAGPKPVIRQASEDGHIDGEIWMSMNESRGLTSHTYNEETAEMIAHKVINKFTSAFQDLSRLLEKEKGL